MPNVSSMLGKKWHIYLFYFLKTDFIYLFWERGSEGEREGEEHPCVVASREPPTGDLARNPGVCPDWESNWQPFGLQAATQSEVAYLSDLNKSFKSFK